MTHQRWAKENLLKIKCLVRDLIVVIKKVVSSFIVRESSKSSEFVEYCKVYASLHQLLKDGHIERHGESAKAAQSQQHGFLDFKSAAVRGDIDCDDGQLFAGGIDRNLCHLCPANAS